MAQPEAGLRLRLLVLGAAALLLLAGLGNVDAWPVDEPRYLQVAEELRAMEAGPGQLALLRLGGEPYLQKPPLYFWLAAAIGAPAGHVSEWAGRLPSALATLGTVALTLLLGSRLFGGRTGVLAAMLLLTTFEFSRYGRRMQLDLLLAVLETAALALYWRVDRGIGRRALQVAGLHLCMGLAVLTKGPVGFLVPALVMLAHCGLERRWRDLARVFPLWALPLSLAPGLVWAGTALAIAPRGAGDEMLGTNLIGRFFEGTSHARPPWYYLAQFPADSLPWSLLWPVVAFVGVRRVFGSRADASDETRRSWRFLLAWLGATLVFFSLSSGKRGLYLLPAFPAVALLSADALVRLAAGRARMPRALAAALAVVGVLLAWACLELALAALAGRTLLADRLLASLLETRLSDALALTRLPFVAAFGSAVTGVILAAAVGWAVLARHKSSALRRFAVVVLAVYGIELSAFLLLFPALDPVRSPRPLALAAAAASPPGAPIGLLGDRAMRGGLLYYGQRPVVALGSPAELPAFVAAGGGAVILKARKLEGVRQVLPVEIVSRARSGRREVLVVRASGGEGAWPHAVGAAPDSPAPAPAPAPDPDGAARRRGAP